MLLAAVTCALVLFRPWSGVFYYRDIALCQYPLFSSLKSLWQADGLPIWDPFHAMGQPLTSNPIFMSLYPMTHLLRFLSPPAYMNVFVAFHWVLMVMGIYALLHRLDVCRSDSAAGALLFGLSGPAVSATIQPMLLLPLAFLPWMLFFAVRKVRRNRVVDEVGASCCLAVVLMAGELASVLAAFVFLTVFFVTEAGLSRAILRTEARTIGLALLLAAPQILPAARLALESGRADGLTYSRLASHSLPPGRLIESVIPEYFGDPLSSSPAVYKGYVLFREGPYFPSIFLGGVPVFLLLFLASRSRSRLRLPLLIAAIFFLLMSLGGFSPVHGFATSAAAPLRSIRFPEKFFLFATLALSLLAAHGLGGIRDVSRFSRLTTIGVFLVALGGYLAGSGVVWKMGVAFSIIPLGFFACAQTLGQRWMVDAGLATWFAAMLWLGIGLNPKTAHLPGGSQVSETVGAVSVARLDDPPDLRLMPPDDSPIWGILWDRDTLNYATGADFGVGTPFERDVAALYTKRQRHLHDAIQGMSFTDMSRLARLYSCEWAITSRVEATEVESSVALRPRAGAYVPVLFLSKLRGPVHPAFAIRAGRAAPGGTGEILRSLLSPGFDWERYALVECEVIPEEGDISKPLGRIEAETGTADSRDVSVRMNRRGYLVMNQSFYPGWKAWVDGERAEIVRANYAVMAVPVPAGDHRVKLVFWPDSFSAGLVILMAGVAISLYRIKRELGGG